MYQEFLPDLIEGFIVRLRADKTWHGDLTEKEREVFLEAAQKFLTLRCIGQTGCDLEDEQTRLTMTFRMLGRIGKLPELGM